jgi:hypothetical protein
LLVNNLILLLILLSVSLDAWNLADSLELLGREYALQGCLDPLLLKRLLGLAFLCFLLLLQACNLLKGSQILLGCVWCAVDEAQVAHELFDLTLEILFLEFG